MIDLIKEVKMAVQGGLVKTRREESGTATFVPSELYANPDRINFRRSPRIRKNFQLAELQERHHEIARLLVLGTPIEKIAKETGMSPLTIKQYKNFPVIKEQINIMSGARDKEVTDVAKQIRNLAPRCVEVLEGILSNDQASDGLKLKTSLAILDRAGHSVPKNVNVKGVHAVVTGETLDAIKQRAIEIASRSDVIDVEPEPEHQ
jgi:hypothetical protein